MIKMKKKHVLSIGFVVASVVLIGLSSWCKDFPIWLRGLLAIVIVLLFVLGELHKSKGRIILKFDRAIAESSLSQLWVAFIMFFMVFDVLMAINTDNSARIFSDMVSPVTMRNAAYMESKDTVVITTPQCLAEDTMRVVLPVVSDTTNLPKPMMKKALFPVLLYLIGLAVFSGVLVATVNQMFATRAKRFRNGLTRYKFKGHIVIIGASDVTISVVKAVLQQWKEQANNEKRKRKSRYFCQIVIMTTADVNNFRKRIKSEIDLKYQEYIVVQYGGLTSKTDMESICVDKASKIIILGETDTRGGERTTHDSDNITCLRLTYRLSQTVLKPIDCYVMFDYQATFTTFQFSDLSNEISSTLNFIPFNLYQMIAQNTLICKSLTCPENGIKPLEGNGIDNTSDKHVHLVVVGMTSMGTAMALEAAQLCHYPNYLRNKKLKTTITFIDQNADREMRFFMGRYRDMFSVAPWRYMEADNENTDYYTSKDFSTAKWHTMSDDLFNKNQLGEDFVDVEWEFVKGGVEQADIQAYLRNISTDANAILSVAVCLEDSHKSAAASLYLPQEVYDNCLQVLVYQPHDNSIVEVLHHTETKEKWSQRYSKLHAFGTGKESVDFSYFNYTLARCVNYIYSSVKYDAISDYGDADIQLTQLINNPTILETEWRNDLRNGKSMAANHWSSIYAANTMWGKLRCIKWKAGTDIPKDDVDLLSEVEHNRWNVEQLIANYRPIQLKDPKEYAVKKNRVHPDLKAYDKLNESTKKYDRAIIMSLPKLYEIWVNGE